MRGRSASPPPPPAGSSWAGTAGGSAPSRGPAEPIRVAVRLRPIKEEHEGSDTDRREHHEGGPVWRIERSGGRHWVSLAPGTPRLHFPSSATLPWAGASGPGRTYEKAQFPFDVCLDGTVGNREVYESAARDVVHTALDGVNATVLAYGQTNSGKTHSVLGTLREPGVLPLAVHDLFNADGGRKMAGLIARVSYYEIFNERVNDLLAPAHAKSANLAVKEDVDRGFYVQGLSETPVHSAKDVLRLVELGEDRRRYAQTRWNEYSSRSHVLFTLTLEQMPALHPPLGAGAPQDGGAPASAGRLALGRTAKLSIVDLAGSENHKLEPSEDGRYINRSLFFLGEVISRLCNAARTEGRGGSARRCQREASPQRPPAGEGQALSHGDGPLAQARRGREAALLRRGAAAVPPADAEQVGTPSSTDSRSPSRARERSADFIPYRDSKLTRILRSSLGGNAVTLLLVTVHPALHFVEQTMTSLRFAAKARCVENHIVVGPDESTRKLDEQSMIDAQQRIIEGLQCKLRALEQQKGPPPEPVPVAAGARGQWDNRHLGRSASGEDVLRGMADGGYLDSWMAQQFQGLRHELEEKEQQLAAKTQLLSERERQLGLLREQLGGRTAHSDEDAPEWRQGHGRGTAGAHAAPRAPAAPGRPPQPPPHGAAAEVPARRKAEICAVGPRHGPPDEGGGLPVVDCGRQAPALAPPLPPAWHAPPAWPPAQGQGGEVPSAFQQVQSRAEDIMCLRSQKYVARQQLPISGPATQKPPAVPSAKVASEGGPSPESQKELVEKLLYLAVMQINSLKAEPALHKDGAASGEKSHPAAVEKPVGPTLLSQRGDAGGGAVRPAEEQVKSSLVCPPGIPKGQQRSWDQLEEIPRAPKREAGSGADLLPPLAQKAVA